MPRVQVWVDLSDESFEAYSGEARRRGVKVESLVAQTVNSLLQEMEHDEKEGTDHPITPA